MQSENINELASALSKAQGQMHAAKKDAENPFFKSKYADLASVWDAIRKPLTDNGLSVTQITEVLPTGALVLRTVLLHSSGQWVYGELPVNPTKNDPQGMGSALTYTRRYGLGAITGAYADDDDGNAASQVAPKERPKPAGKLSEPSGIQDGDPVHGLTFHVAKNDKAKTKSNADYYTLTGTDEAGNAQRIKAFGPSAGQAKDLQPGDWCVIDGKWSEFKGSFSINADVIKGGKDDPIKF